MTARYPVTIDEDANNEAARKTGEQTGRIGQRRQIVIPQDICDTLELREGDFVAFTKKDNGVLITPRRQVDPNDVLTPAEAIKVRHALKQVKAGKTRPWCQIKDEMGL